MIIPQNYYINVCKNGIHYCNIELGDCMEKVAEKKMDELVDIFPENFELFLMHVTCYGEDVNRKNGNKKS